MGVKRRTQAERSAGTRASLLAAARELFARDGFAGTGREDIAEAAGVTRGALYHHFADKTDLFRALYESLESEIMERIMTAAMASPDDPMEQLRLGSQAFLDAALDPAVQRVVLIDGPSVLSWEVRHEIGEQTSHGMVREVLSALMESGRIERQPIEPLTRMLLAALNEAALYVARATDHEAARADAGRTVDHFLSRL